MKGLAARRGIGALVLLGAVALVYANSLHNSFHYDDSHSIVENPHIRSLGNVPAFFVHPEYFSRDPDKAMYRPLLLVSLALNHAWSGYQVYSYHLVNVLLHGLCSLLVWGTLRQLGRPPGMALGGGLLFALHPIAVEPVNYISSRSELLAAVAVLGGFWLYQIAQQERSRRSMIGSVLLFAAGLLSKATAVVLPVLLLLWDGLRGELKRDACRRYLPYGVLVLLFLVYQLFIGGFLARAVVVRPVRPMDVQLGTQLKALPYYLKLLFVPTGLTVDHAFSESGLTSATVLVALVFLLSLGWWVVAVRQDRTGALLGAGWMLVCLAPASLVPLNVLVNEHRLYLPLAGLVFYLSGLERLERVPGLWKGAVFFLLFLGALTTARNRVWQDEESLWQDAAARGPGLVRPLVYLGNCARDRGELEKGAGFYQKALQLDPGNTAARNNLGNAFRLLGQFDQAVAVYRELLAAHPELGEVRYNLARALQDAGRDQEAEEYYRSVPAANYHYPLALNNLGYLCEKRGQADSALVCYGRALARPGQWPDAWKNFRRLGERLYREGRLAQVEAVCRQLLQESERHPEARFLLAAALSGQGRYSESISESEALVAQVPDFDEGYLQLGQTLEVSGRLEEARQAYQRLLDRTRDAQLQQLGRQHLQALEGRMAR